MSEVWVAGEALIDLISDGTEETPVVGGGPANTATALAKLGITTQFINCISTDLYGQIVLEQLLQNGVLLKYISFSDMPTSIATVSLDGKGCATYEFLTDGTATFNYNPDWLPNSSTLQPSLVYTGSLVSIIEPASSVLYNWVSLLKKFVPIVYDPNVRPAVMASRSEYLRYVEKWIKIASVVKASEDDIYWLYPNKNVDDVVRSWLEMGPELIVVTMGEKGLSGFRKGEKLSIAAKKVVVVDSIGAGDTVSAILIESILEFGIENLFGKTLRNTLNRAAKAASIIVSRAGAIPPKRDELL